MALTSLWCRAGSLSPYVLAVLLVACQEQAAVPQRTPSAKAASHGGSPGDDDRHHKSRGPRGDGSQAEDSGTPGVLVRLKGDASFETHAKERGRGRGVARSAALAQKASIRNQHGRILKALVQKVGGLAARRGHGKVVGASYEEFFGALNAVALHGIDKDAAARLLKDENDVLSIEPIVQVQADLVESVPLIDGDDLWSMADANGLAIDGAGMRIGIVDTGVDYRHADLGGCFGPGCKVAGGYDFVNDDPDPMDDYGHGTHVAATAAGNGSYAGAQGPVPIRGVAPGALIYAYKVLNANGYGSNTDIIAAIERCADPDDDGDPSDHLDVCNLSLGGGGNPDDAMSTAVDNATASGVAFAISAGNGGPASYTIGSPGTARQAITVAAACKPSSIGVDYRCAQAISSTSSRGPVLWSNGSGSQTLAKPDVAAPGVAICAARWSSYPGGSLCLDSYHLSMSGTSMASPHVAGVAALLRQGHPEWTPAQVKTFIMSSAHNLGLDVYTQGAGEIDAQDALTLGGLPTSFARLSGTPLRDMDVPTSRFGTFVSALTITNTSAQALTFVPSASGDAGLAISFEPASIALGPGASGSLAVTRVVDHDVVASGTEARGTIVLTTELGEVRVGIQVGVRDRLAADTPVVDVGVDLASQANWTGQATLHLTNLRLDTPATYTAAVSCCNSTYQNGGSDITASLDQTSLTIPAGGVVALGLTVRANNAPFSNGRFDGYITLTSPLGTMTVPVTFFKGYGIQIVTTPMAPEGIALSSAQSGSTIVVSPASTSLTFLSTTPGPFFAEARWIGWSPYGHTHVLAGNIATDVPMRTVTLDRAQATYALETRLTDQTGSPASSSTSVYRFTHSASGGGLFTYGTGDGGKILTSAIPEGINYTATAVAYSPDPIAYFYELPGPHAADHVFTNTPEALVTKELRLFRPASPGNTPFLSLQTCLVIPYRALTNGTLTGGGAQCDMSALAGFSLPSGVGHMRFYNSSNRDLTTAPYPDAPAVTFQLLDGSASGTTLYFGPMMNVTATHTYLWDMVMPWSNTVRADQVYARFLCDEPPGDVLPIGPGPLVGQWTWYNHRTDQFAFRPPKAPYSYPFAWGGCWEDYTMSRYPISYRLYRDNALVASGSLTSPSGLYPSAADGLHRLEVTRDAVIAGFTTTVETVSTFTVSSTSSIDENPPALRSLHLLGHGLWQDVFDPAVGNRLQFVLDPLPGFVDWSASPPPQFTTMADSLASVRVEQSTDGNTWVDVAITATGGGAYVTGDLDISASLALLWFRISASDSAGNTFRHTFQIPRGTGYAPANSDTTPPTTAITSPSEDASLSGAVTVNVAAADDVGVTRVDLYVDGVRLGSSATPPYAFTWNTGTVSSGGHVLTARALDAAGNVGHALPVSVRTSNIDTTPPTVAFLSPAEGALVHDAVTLQATASDDQAIARVDFYDGPALIGNDLSAPYETTWNSTSAAAGAHTLLALAFDVAGNSAVAQVQVTVDNTAPTVAITAPANGATVSGTVSVTASASDAAGVTRVDFYDGTSLIGSATTAPFAVTWNTTPVTKGAHTLKARAFDSAGNSADSAAIGVTVSADAVPPSVTITSPSEGAVVKGVIWWRTSATDNVGVTHIQFFCDGVLQRDYNGATIDFTWDTAGIAEGGHDLTARAFDAGGNSTLSAPVHIVIDRTPPSVAATSPAQYARLSGVVSINATASDTVGMARVDFIDYSDFTTIATDTTPPYSYDWDTTTVPDGVRYIRVHAVDLAGNFSDAFITVIIDNCVTAAISAPAADSWIGGPVPITVATSKDSSVGIVTFRDGYMTLGTVTAPPFSMTWTPTTAGAHSLTAIVTCKANRVVTTPAVSVNVDFALPTVTLTAPTDGATVSGTVTVRATAADDVSVSRVDFIMDGAVPLGSATTAPYAIQWDVSGVAIGAHTLAARAYDGLGGSTLSTAVQITVDHAAPIIAITSPLPGAVLTGVVQINATASDDAGVQKVELLDGSSLLATLTSSPYIYAWSTYGVADGGHAIVARATDRAGHTTEATVSVTVDNSVAVAITAPVSGATIGASTAVTATTTNDGAVASVTFYDGAAAIGTVTTAPFAVTWLPATAGLHALTARATDRSGRVSTSPAVTVTADLSAPMVAVTAPANNAVVGGVVNVTASASDDVSVTRVDFILDGNVPLGSATAAAYGVSWDTAAVANGVHALTARVFDGLGSSSLSAAVQVIVDHTPPVVAMTAPLPGAVVTGAVSVDATASDDLGVLKVELYEGSTLLGTAASPPYRFTWNSYAAADGSHSLMARATDLAGNLAEASVTVTVNNSVAISLTTPTPGAWVGGPVPVSAATTNDGAVASITFYDGGNAIGSVTAPPFAVTWTPAAVGAHTLTAEATDRQGRVTTSPSVSVNVDLAVPTVVLTAPANGATVSGTVTVSATAADDTGVSLVELYRDATVLLGTASTSPYSISWNTTATAAGSHTLTAVAYDAAGHATTSASRTVTVRDTTAPTVRITYPSGGSRVPAGGVVTIQATAADASPLTKVDFYVANSLKCSDTSAPYSCNWSVPTTKGRSYALKAKAYDSSGNVATSPTVTVTSQ